MSRKHLGKHATRVLGTSHDQGMQPATPPSLTDWRGIPITPGAYVVYAAESSGRQNRMVEGRIRPSDVGPMLTTTGDRVWVRVLRRATGGGVPGAQEYVHIAPSRVTVLHGPLPASSYPTEPATLAAERDEIARRKENEKSHRIEKSQQVGSFRRICKNCSAVNTGLALSSCDDQAERDAIANGDAENARDFADKVIAEKALRAAFTPSQLAVMGMA